MRVQAGATAREAKTEAAMYAHELVMKARQDEPPYAAAPERQAGEPVV
jgi:hypothetical protein